MNDKPQSRIEEFLECVALGGEAEKLPCPQSRIEEFLKCIIDGGIKDLPQPQSRVEEYLDYIARNGGIGGGGSGDKDWIVIRSSLEDALNLPKLISLNGLGTSSNVSASITSPSKIHYFTLNEKDMFLKEPSDIFVFNGNYADLKDDTKFCNITNQQKQINPSKSTLEEGYVFSVCITKDVDDIIDDKLYITEEISNE